MNERFWRRAVQSRTRNKPCVLGLIAIKFVRRIQTVGSTARAIASALPGNPMSKLCGSVPKAASGRTKGDVAATITTTARLGEFVINAAICGAAVPILYAALQCLVSRAIAAAWKGQLE